MNAPQRSSKFLMFALTVCACFAMNACAVKQHGQNDIVVLDYRALSLETPSGSMTKGDEKTEIKQINAIISEAMKDAAAQSTAAPLEIIRKVVTALGENGYAAIDGENQINLTNAAQVIDFCNAVSAKQRAELTIIQVIGSDGLYGAFGHAQSGAAQAHMLQGYQKYDFHTQDGTVELDRNFYQYSQDNPDQNFTVKDTVSYRADLWQYTQDGYLLFGGSYFSEDYYIISLTDAPEYAAVRVAPLDEQCRELNRRYIQPVGYACNNLFLVNWDETDFAKLDLNDLFDRFYPMVSDKPSPYVLDENPNEGIIYRISEKEFEHVVQAYLNINRAVLQSKAGYVPEEKVYLYRPRGLYETECTNQPSPEVTGCTENADGTLTLTVNAVFPYENTAKAFSHEVTIRLLEDGSFQYVSNKIDGGTYEAWWRTERLTDEEWQEIYGEQYLKNDTQINESETEEALWYLPHSDNFLLTEAEQTELENTILAAAKTVSPQYQNKEYVQGTSYASNISGFRKEDCCEVVRLLGKAGYISTADDCNMENYEEVEAFYQAYIQAQEASVTIFQVHSDGLLGVITFLYRKGILQAYYVGVDWKEGGIPYIKNTLVSDVAKMEYTPKGYFIYTYRDEIVHSNANEYLRVKPLSDKCRELTRKYVSGISFANYDAFVTSWDSSTVEEILEPCLFEEFYRMSTGEGVRTENDRIPAEEYERIMMIYFPATKEQLRRKCGYDAASGTYPYEMIFAVPYAPFGEVVDYTQNKDGTLTLIVDGVWIDRNMDCAFTNEIVVQPSADGTFRYLSNKCLSK